MGIALLLLLAELIAIGSFFFIAKMRDSVSMYHKNSRLDPTFSLTLDKERQVEY
jgi:hypothetical protein